MFCCAFSFSRCFIWILFYSWTCWIRSLSSLCKIQEIGVSIGVSFSWARFILWEAILTSSDYSSCSSRYSLTVCTIVSLRWICTGKMCFSVSLTGLDWYELCVAKSGIKLPFTSTPPGLFSKTSSSSSDDVSDEEDSVGYGVGYFRDMPSVTNIPLKNLVI